MASKELYGRSIIYSDVEEVDSSNISDVLDNALKTHNTNSSDIDYLYDYYRGRQEIRNKQKTFRTDINNIITENRAFEIVNFKTGYLVGEPVVYISRGTSDESDSDLTAAIDRLNEFMAYENKAVCDKSLVDWIHICGVGFRLVLPDISEEVDEAPFELFTLDPRYTFVIYSSDISHKPLAAVTYITLEDDSKVYSVYTPTEMLKVDEDYNVLEHTPHTLGCVPIFEYRGNSSLLGAFEPALSLLDALNAIQSNRLDSIESFVDSILVAVGFDLSEKEVQALTQLKAVSVPKDCRLEYISQLLNQSETQTLVDDIYTSILQICGLPTGRKSSVFSSDHSSTAVMLRDGWSTTEAVAKSYEEMFKLSERNFLKCVLTIFNNTPGLDVSELLLSDIDIHFSRRNFEDIASKSQVLTTMLNNDKIHPLLAFTHSGMFTDPVEAYEMSEKYRLEHENAQVDSLNAISDTHIDLE